MLAIRLQRTGRKGHAQFRVVVQDARLSPASGRVVARLGHYNPHTKDTVLDKEKATTYLANGAQPSERVVTLLKKEGVKLPKWVNKPIKQKRTTRNPEKLRKNRPEGVEAPVKETPADSSEAVEETEATPAEVSQPTEASAEEKPAENDTPSPEAEEKPAEEKSTEKASEPSAEEKSEEPVAEDKA